MTTNTHHHVLKWVHENMTSKATILLIFYLLVPIIATKDASGTKKSQNRQLPEKVIVSYTTNKCDDLDQMEKVTSAIQNGVNVLIWSFHAYVVERDVQTGSKSKLKLETKLNATNYLAYKNTLREMGHGNILHLVSFGGWDGKHLPSGVTSEELYLEFQSYNTQNHTLDRSMVLFDGIDWDLEGNDDLQHPNNKFTIECLNQMGGLSRLMKHNGYIVTMVRSTNNNCENIMLQIHRSATCLYFVKRRLQNLIWILPT